jgi:hypothetical protein|tara:strand:- start:595 stop:924 length:330 start_codon:yes stop_codon:yes gene_type:complete
MSTDIQQNELTTNDNDVLITYLIKDLNKLELELDKLVKDQFTGKVDDNSIEAVTVMRKVIKAHELASKLSASDCWSDLAERTFVGMVDVFAFSYGDRCEKLGLPNRFAE